ncbi:MAG: RDD family protein [Actinomycetes bacterium]
MTSIRRPIDFASLPAAAQDVQGTRAGFASRAAAGFIDLLVTGVLLIAVYLGVAGLTFLWRPRDFTFPTPSSFVVGLTASLLAAAYFTATWSTTGRTYGDGVLGLRVVTRRGARMHVGVALLRAATTVIFPIGLLWLAFDRDNRSVQDLLCRTSVLYDWSTRGR